MEKIDWGKIPEGFDWVATDENGELWAYKRKPEDGYCLWFVDNDKDAIRISDPVAGGYKGGSWRESLQHRPAKKPEIKFGKGTNEVWGPRPEKLWVGMKGIMRDGFLATLDDMTTNCLTWRCSTVIITTSTTGRFGEDSQYNIVKWEQPVVTCCGPEPEPDYKAKYEQLQQEVADLIDYRGSYAELRWHYLRLKDELERTQAELNDVYKDREKLNKIVKIIHGLGHE